MAIEYELKFRATEAVLAEIRQAYPGQCREYQMETTYYDTPSRSLSARHYTLRRRMENDVSVCTLKTPAEGHGRQELETQCRNIEDAIPVLCKLGAPENLMALTQKGVAPVCGARFIRQSLAVEIPQGVVELALDKGILFAGDRELPICEVEVELKDGEPNAAVQFASLLAEKYALQPEHRSKFKRAKALGEP